MHDERQLLPHTEQRRRPPQRAADGDARWLWRSARQRERRCAAAPQRERPTQRASIRARAASVPLRTSSPTSSPRPPRSSRRGRRGSAPTTRTPRREPDAQRLAAAWDAFGERMADHYPFFHPRYAGQMLKPPHPVAVAGYLAAMLVNPNNHALDGGPGASGLEVEVVEQLRVMFGLPSPGLGHLTSSGTIANLEALWVAREVHPASASCTAPPRTTPTRACASCSHHGHRRRTRRARAARPRRRGGRVREGATSGPSCSPPGSTGLGAIDRVDEALALRERYGVRLHVDGAYGGFFTLLARGDDPLVAPAPYAAIAQCDSVVVDPHKHGLQPYGCGAILFADPVGRARLSPRLALHLLHRGRAAPRRDQPRVLARRRGGRRRCG